MEELTETKKQRARRKRREKETSMTQEHEAIVNQENEIPVADAENVTKPQKKKKKKVAGESVSKKRESESYPPDQIMLAVAQLKDDIVEMESGIGEPPNVSPDDSVWHTEQPTFRHGSKVYVEHNGNFKAVARHVLSEVSSIKKSNKKKEDSKVVPSAVRLGLALHAAIQRLATYCHGLLAGFALWHCVVVYELSPPHFPVSDFLHHYCPLASATQAAFYLMLVICIFSLMGRCNIASEESGLWEQIIHFHSGLYALVFYFIALLLNLAIANIDDGLALYARNSTIVIQNVDSHLPTWKNVTLTRCIAVLLAWFILAFRPSQNLLLDHLRSLAS